jgi:4'-phosphopantetheinyl transferase
MTTNLPPLSTPVFSSAADFDPAGAHEVNTVCLWLLDINQLTAAHYAEAERIMSDSEQERAQKFIRGKEAYIASRWLLRKVLARYTGSAPEAVTLLRSNRGKPFLAQSNIQFSLSHSSHWALLAVGDALLIGADIEEVKTTRDLTGIAESYYHHNEFTRLQGLDTATQADYFYRLWTLKEAFFKATGSGISAGLDKIEFTLTANNISASIASELDAGSVYWQFQQWALSAHDYCALAYKDPRNLHAKWFDALATPAFP